MNPRHPPANSDRPRELREAERQRLASLIGRLLARHWLRERRDGVDTPQNSPAKSEDRLPRRDPS